MSKLGISIITPVLNGEYFIRENIESILKLKECHEHIIIDGGSTDQTLKILEEYPHLTVYHQQGKNGMYEAIDIGFRAAKGDYVGWVNCDDRIIPGGFQKMYQYAVSKDLDFVCSDGVFEYIREGYKRKVKGTHFVKYLLNAGIMPFSQPSTLFKRELYFKAGAFDCTHFKICGDMDLFWRFSNIAESRFGYIKVVSTLFIRHGNSLGDRGTQLGKRERAASNLPKVKKYNMFLHRLVRILGI